MALIDKINAIQMKVPVAQTKVTKQFVPNNQTPTTQFVPTKQVTPATPLVPQNVQVNPTLPVATSGGDTTKVTAEALTSSKYNIPAPVKDTTASSNLASTIARATTPTPEPTVSPTSERQKIIEGINAVLGTQQGQADFTAQAQQDAQLEQKRVALNDFNKQAVDTKKSYEDKIKALKENPQGMSQGQLDNAVSQLEMKANEDLANIALQKSVAQGDVNLALQIVKDKVDAKFEPLKNQIENFKLQYQILQNDMTDSQKVEAQNIQKQLERDYDTQVAQTKRLEEYKLEALKNGIATTSNNIADIAREISQKTGKNVSSDTINAYSLSNDILNSDYAAITGIPSPSSFIPGTSAQYVKNQFNQLNAFLSLENRAKLKGSGAISDFEAKTLNRAASSLGTNLSNEDFGNELRKVRGVLATAAGLSATVELIDPSNGTSLGVVSSDRTGINKAIADGLLVEYK